MSNDDITVTEEVFWEIVEEINWDERCEEISLDEENIRLMKRFNKEAARELQRISSEKEGEVYEAFEDYLYKEGTSVGLGDDSFSDLCSHIVGLGREEFEAHLNNPELIYQRAVKGNFKEKFSYVFPYPSDYENLDAAKYKKWADRVVNEHQEILDDWKYSKEYKSVWRRIFEILNIASKGNFDDFLSHEEECKELAEKVMSNKWSVWNLFSDLRKYYIQFQ